METKLKENSKTTENILEDVCTIIDEARRNAYKAVNVALVKRNWLIGKRIAEEELKAEINHQKTMLEIENKKQI